MTEEQLMKRIERDQLRAAQREVEKATRHFLRACEVAHRAWDKRSEAEDSLLLEAKHHLSLVQLSQEKAHV